MCHISFHFIAIHVYSFLPSENRTTAIYHPTIPPVGEPNANRKIDVPRLREVRKKLDSSHTSAKEVQAIAEECMDDIVELSSGKRRVFWVT